MNEHARHANTVPLISKERIEERVRALALEIRQVYAAEPPVVVAVLKGSFVFVADLLRALGLDCSLEFISVGSYVGAKSSGAVGIKLDVSSDIEGREVLVVEDIVDSGLTLDHIVGLLQAKRPKRIMVATLLFKPSAFRGAVKPQFIGFEVGPEFVVGYGLDLDGRYRWLPDIHVASEVEARGSPADK